MHGFGTFLLSIFKKNTNEKIIFCFSKKLLKWCSSFLHFYFLPLLQGRSKTKHTSLPLFWWKTLKWQVCRMHQFSTFLLLYGILISFHLLISKISKNHDEIVHWVILATISLDKQRTEFLFCIHICMSITSFVTPSQPNIFKYNIHFSLLLRHITAIITNYFWYPVITLRNKNNRYFQLARKY